MDEYVNCLANYNTRNYFMTMETDYTTFMNIPDNAINYDPNYNWLPNYGFGHFVTLVHSLTNVNQVLPVLTKAAAFNAMNVYVTNRIEAIEDPWSDLAASPYWYSEYNQMIYEQEPPSPQLMYFPGGSYDRAQYAPCPQGGASCCPDKSSTEL
jgi:hypothetical protein